MMKIVDTFNIYSVKKLKQLEINDKDIKNAKQLAYKLKDEDKYRTISNILEWQDRNIKYWYERGYLYAYILVISIIKYIILTILLFPSNFLNSDIPLLIKCGIIFLIIFFAVILESAIYLYFKYNYQSNKILKTFKLNISIKDILNYKLAICRDYAKLTSAILHNLNIEHYFLITPGHVAVAVKIDDKYYVIDKHLPLRDMDEWLKKQGREDIPMYAPKDKYNSKLDRIPRNE